MDLADLEKKYSEQLIYKFIYKNKKFGKKHKLLAFEMRSKRQRPTL